MYVHTAVGLNYRLQSQFNGPCLGGEYDADQNRPQRNAENTVSEPLWAYSEACTAATRNTLIKTDPCPAVHGSRPGQEANGPCSGGEYDSDQNWPQRNAENTVSEPLWVYFGRVPPLETRLLRQVGVWRYTDLGCVKGPMDLVLMANAIPIRMGRNKTPKIRFRSRFRCTLVVYRHWKLDP
jgi:hypothetical protein